MEGIGELQTMQRRPTIGNDRSATHHPYIDRGVDALYLHSRMRKQAVVPFPPLPDAEWGDGCSELDYLGID